MGIRSLRFFVASVFALLLLILGERLAWAEAKGTLVIIVEGGGGEKLRGAIGDELPEGWSRASNKAVAAAAKKRELPESLKALDSPATKGPYLVRASQVAADVGAKGTVVVHIPKGKKREAQVIMVSAAGGTLLDKQVPLTTAPEDAGLVTKAFTAELEKLGPQEEAKPEPTPAPTAPGAAPTPAAETPKPAPTAPAPAPAAKPAPSKPDTAEIPWFGATVALELANRNLSYRQAVTPNIHTYDSGLVLTPAIALELFPFSPGGSGFFQELGLFGDFKLGFVGDRKVQGEKASASWTRFDVGLKYRIWFRRDVRAPMIAPSVSFGQESFSFKDPDPPPNDPLDTPSVSYKMVRPRVEARVPIGPLAVLGGAGFLWVLDAGKVEGKFRDPSVLGWEADIAVAVPLGKLFEVRGGFAYRRYIYWFSPVKGDDTIANGAHDQIYRGDLGVSIRL